MKGAIRARAGSALARHFCFSAREIIESLREEVYEWQYGRKKKRQCRK
jgi:hypothetical protein